MKQPLFLLRYYLLLPHIWEKSYGICWDTQESLAYEPWPVFNEEFLKEDNLIIRYHLMER